MLIKITMLTVDKLHSQLPKLLTHYCNVYMPQSETDTYCHATLTTVLTTYS